MKNKKRSTKTKNNPNESFEFRFKPNLPPTVKILLLVVAIVIVSWLLIFSGAVRYSVSVHEARDRLNTVLESTDVQGKQIASKTLDLGCDNGGVGLQTRIVCSLEGYRYFELGEDKKTALQRMNAKIESLGFKKLTYNETVDNQILAGSEEGDVDYVKHRTSVQLGWSVLPTTNVNGPGSTAISQALSSHRISDVKNPKTIVGIVAREGYWSCTAGRMDIMGLTCIFPPHEPNQWSEV